MSRALPVFQVVQAGVSGLVSTRELVVALGKIAAFVVLGFILYGSYFKLNPYESTDYVGWEWDFVDCWYFTMATLTTVGYGDMPLLSQHARAITAAFGLVGVLIVANSIGVIADWFVEVRSEICYVAEMWRSSADQWDVCGRTRGAWVRGPGATRVDPEPTFRFPPAILFHRARGVPSLRLLTRPDLLRRDRLPPHADEEGVRLDLVEPGAAQPERTPFNYGTVHPAGALRGLAAVSWRREYQRTDRPRRPSVSELVRACAAGRR